jgi:bifunctional DNase/RNase
MEVRMDLSRIIISETSDQQIIVLKERSGARQFPIVIGIHEALAIDRRLKGFPTQRPLTHELLANVIESMSGDLERIVIHDLRDHTFYAKLVIRQNGNLLEIDSRPSDAIALGVASDTPIYVAEQVLREVSDASPEA